MSSTKDAYGFDVIYFVEVALSTLSWFQRYIYPCFQGCITGIGVIRTDEETFRDTGKSERNNDKQQATTK